MKYPNKFKLQGLNKIFLLGNINAPASERKVSIGMGKEETIFICLIFSVSMIFSDVSQIILADSQMMKEYCQGNILFK